MTKEIKDTQNIDNETQGSHEYDGIKELNNPAPNWILLILMATIFFSLIYLVHYFGYPGNKMDQDSEYLKESAKFDKKLAANNPSSGKAISLEEMIEKGSKLFAEKGCIACHGMKGEGNAIGPNLTDKYWLNGCTTENIVNIITNGKPEKGMAPYKTMMTQEQIQQLSAFVKGSLVGSNSENGKDAQGELCE